MTAITHPITGHPSLRVLSTMAPDRHRFEVVRVSPKPGVKLCAVSEPLYLHHDKAAPLWTISGHPGELREPRDWQHWPTETRSYVEGRDLILSIFQTWADAYAKQLDEVKP